MQLRLEIAALKEANDLTDIDEEEIANGHVVNV